jgi:hypothetical protein
MVFFSLFFLKNLEVGKGGGWRGEFFFSFAFCYSFIIWKFFVTFCLFLKGEGWHEFF